MALASNEFFFFAIYGIHEYSKSIKIIEVIS